MALHIIEGDITDMDTDAIVNAANSTLLGGGGVDGAIHRRAGIGLLEECKTLGGCRTGEAKITSAYNLPCKYVIHTVGPIYRDGKHDEENALRNCYRNSLRIAEEKGMKSIAFPLISAGAYRYPKQEAYNIAVNEIETFLNKHDLEVYLVLYNGKH